MFISVGLSAQHMIVSTSFTKPETQTIDATYGSAIELEVGVMAHLSERLFITVGLDYISWSHDVDRLLQGIEGYPPIQEIIGGDASFIGLQAGLGYVFTEPRRWFNPYLSGSLAVGSTKMKTFASKPNATGPRTRTS